MVEAGITGDIMLCYNVMGAQKLERLRAVSQLTDITLTVDSEYTARGISAYADPNHPINLVVELAMPNFERTGVPTQEDALALAKVIDKLPGVHFRGLMVYPSTKPEQQEKTVAARELFRAEMACRWRLSAAGDRWTSMTCTRSLTLPRYVSGPSTTVTAIRSATAS